MFCILYLLIFKDSNNAIVSPGNLLKCISSKTTIDPLGILGRKYCNATLVGKYKSKSKYNKLINICSFFFIYSGIVSSALPLTNSILLKSLYIDSV